MAKEHLRYEFKHRLNERIRIGVTPEERINRLLISLNKQPHAAKAIKKAL